MLKTSNIRTSERNIKWWAGNSMSHKYERDKGIKSKKTRRRGRRRGANPQQLSSSAGFTSAAAAHCCRCRSCCFCCCASSSWCFPLLSIIRATFVSESHHRTMALVRSCPHVAPRFHQQISSGAHSRYLFYEVKPTSGHECTKHWCIDECEETTKWGHPLNVLSPNGRNENNPKNKEKGERKKTDLLLVHMKWHQTTVPIIIWSLPLSRTHIDITSFDQVHVRWCE